MAVTGVMAFALPFSIQIVGLHSLIGFVFIGLIALHVFNNNHRLTRYLKSRIVWIALAVVALLVALFLWQPAPIKSVLGLSKNLGPSLDDYEVTDLGLSYHYTPDPESPPNFAIWLENASEYHIKTLHTPTGDGGRTALPYWDFKRRGWEEAKRDAESSGKDLAEELEVDAVSGATENSSFNPADYILPGDAEESLPYRLLIEINQPGDDQASLVYAVDIDNITPRTFQLLDLVGYPKREEDDEDGEDCEWG